MEEEKIKSRFNPEEHLITIEDKDGAKKKYLEVQWRIVWFRADHGDTWGIVPNLEHLDANAAVASTEIRDPDGIVVAKGYGRALAVESERYVETACTRATGRALALMGYGTQFADSSPRDEIPVDSGVRIVQPTIPGPFADAMKMAADVGKAEKAEPEADPVPPVTATESVPAAEPAPIPAAEEPVKQEEPKPEPKVYKFTVEEARNYRLNMGRNSKLTGRTLGEIVAAGEQAKLDVIVRNAHHYPEAAAAARTLLNFCAG